MRPLGVARRELAPQRSDAELVAAARAHDDGARAALCRRYARMARGLAFRYSGRLSEVDDIVQDAFVDALRTLHKLQHDAAFGSWFTRIVVAIARQHIRKQRLQRRLGLRATAPADVAHIAAPDAPPDVVAELAQLYRILDELPERPRIALLMRHLEGRQLDEIATMLGGSRSSVKRWLAVAEERVREDVVLNRYVRAARAPVDGEP